MTKAALSIGSNLGDRFSYLQNAVTSICQHPKISNVKVSSVYETKPVGGVEQDDFLNAVISLETELTPEELLKFAQQLENEAERVREVRWGPRTLDVDILVHGKEVLNSVELTLPHPRIAERSFVLVPWFEIAPVEEIPNLGKLAKLHDSISKSEVVKNPDYQLVVSKNC